MEQPTYGPLRDIQGRAIYPTTITPEQAAEAQRQKSEKVFAAIEARKEREAAAAQARADAEHQAGVAELDQYESEAHAAWLASGGDAAGFAKNWPQLRDEHLRQRATERMGARERLVNDKVEKLRAARRSGML
jgi:hypothetical protein